MPRARHSWPNGSRQAPTTSSTTNLRRWRCGCRARPARRRQTAVPFANIDRPIRGRRCRRLADDTDPGASNAKAKRKRLAAGVSKLARRFSSCAVVEAHPRWRGVPLRNDGSPRLQAASKLNGHDKHERHQLRDRDEAPVDGRHSHRPDRDRQCHRPVAGDTRRRVAFSP